MKKTNAMRILDSMKIPYEAKEYDDDEEHALELGAAGRTAGKLGIPPESVFKTIVMRTDSKEICVFCQNALSKIKRTFPIIKHGTYFMSLHHGSIVRCSQTHQNS